MIMQANKNDGEGANAQLLIKLPKDLVERDQLKTAILNRAQKLSKTNKNLHDEELYKKIQRLQLRINLIDGCEEMSLLRLGHLEEIFKHYCTHIFKTGKHMTFDRLEYEKVHLTMERFFLFLKDFQLTIMRKSEKKEEVIQKNAVVTIFKKISSNCRDLSFEEFIQAIEKLAILYYNEKQIFYEKKEKLKQQKQNRKKQYERRQKLRMKRLAMDKGQSGEQPSQQNDGEEGQENEEDDKNQSEQGKKQEENENDDLVNDMINDKNLEDPNEEVNRISNRYAIEREQDQNEDAGQAESPKGKVSFQKSRYEDLDDAMLLALTDEQKIQFYYQVMIKVDSVSDYRQKLTDLNLPIFQKQRSKTRSTIQHAESKARNMSIDESARFEELKKKMDQKKLKQKASPIPKHKDDDVWNKAQEEKRRKREVKKEREEMAKKKSKQESDALAQKKIDSMKAVKEKKAQFNEKSIDFATLGKISIDQLKLKQFNPNKYYSKDDDDSTFLDEYEGNRPRIATGIAIRERNSIALVNDMKKRVNQVEQKEKKQQKQLDYKIGKGASVKNKF